MNRKTLHKHLNTLHQQLNHKKFIHPDPLEFVHHYSNPLDQEIVGLIAALLAYGRVAQILKSIDTALTPMGASPRDYLLHANPQTLTRDFQHFQHRWTRGSDLIHLAQGIQHLLQTHDSLENAFLASFTPDDTNTITPLSRWIHALNPTNTKNSLLSDPAKGSACKRLHLYLRWMIRKDAIDPGPWTTISPALLIIPLDTHMFKVAKKFRMTKRKSPDGKAALDMTNAFKKMEPQDPLKFDFALTRLGIRTEMDLTQFLNNTQYTPQNNQK